MVIRGPLTNSEGLHLISKAIKETQSDLLGKLKLDTYRRESEALPRRGEQNRKCFIYRGSKRPHNEVNVRCYQFLSTVKRKPSEAKKFLPANAVRMCKCALRLTSNLWVICGSQ